MKITGSITYIGLSASELEAGGLVRVFERAEKEAMLDAARYWRDKILPKHFGPRAAALYRYAHRSISYLRRKAARLHTVRPRGPGKGTAPDLRPLEFSGESKRRILGSKPDPRYGRRGGLKAVEVPIIAPKHFYQYSTKGRIVDKMAEITTLTDAELSELASMVQEGITRRLDAHRSRRKVRRIA